MAEKPNPGPGVADVLRVHEQAEAARAAELQALLNDPKLKYRRTRVLWPEEVGRTSLSLAGVVLTHVANFFVWTWATDYVWNDLPAGMERAIIVCVPALFAMSNAALVVEELWRQWRVR